MTLIAKRQELRIDMITWDDFKRYAKYDNFRVGRAHDFYSLRSTGTHEGDCGQYGMTILDMDDVRILLISIGYYRIHSL